MLIVIPYTSGAVNRRFSAHLSHIHPMPMGGWVAVTAWRNRVPATAAVPGAVFVPYAEGDSVAGAHAWRRSPHLRFGCRSAPWVESRIRTGAPWALCPAGTSSARPEATSVKVHGPSPFRLARRRRCAPPSASRISVRVPWPGLPESAAAPKYRPCPACRKPRERTGPMRRRAPGEVPAGHTGGRGLRRAATGLSEPGHEGPISLCGGEEPIRRQCRGVVRPGSGDRQEGPLLVGGAVAVPPDQLPAVGGGRAGVVEATAGDRVAVTTRPGGGCPVGAASFTVEAACTSLGSGEREPSGDRAGRREHPGRYPPGARGRPLPVTNGRDRRRADTGWTLSGQGPHRPSKPPLQSRPPVGRPPPWWARPRGRGAVGVPATSTAAAPTRAEAFTREPGERAGEETGTPSGARAGPSRHRTLTSNRFTPSRPDSRRCLVRVFPI